MKKVISILLLIIVLFHVTGIKVLCENNSDIVIMRYDQSKKKIVSGEEFTFTMTYKKFTDVEINDIYLTVDDNSAFYISKHQPQIVKLENLSGDDEKLVDIDLVYKGVGKELKLIFKYNKEGSLCQSSSTLYLDTIENNDNKNAVETMKQIPNIKIVGDVSIPVGEAGKSVDIEIPIKNISSFKAKNITTSIISDSNLISSKVNKINLYDVIDEISPNKTKKLKFSINISPFAESGDYTVMLEFNYFNVNGESFTSSDNIILRVKNNNRRPFLVLKKIESNPSCPLPGDEMNIFFKLENLGTFDAKDVKLTVDGYKEDGIIPKFTGVKYLESIGGGKSKNGFLEFKVSEEINTKNHQIKFIVNYKDDQSNTYSDQFIYYIPINIVKKSSFAFLKIENLDMSTRKVHPNEEFKIYFDIKNDGNKKASNVKVWLVNDSEIVSKSLNTMMIDSIDIGESKHVEFVMEAREEAISKNYPIAINIEYEEDKDSSKQVITQYVGILVDNVSEETDTGKDKSVPKIIIESYSVSPQTVLAGEECNVDLDIKNTHKNKNVYNIKINITNQNNEILLGRNNNGSIYIEEIKARSVVHKSVSFVTGFSTQPKVYSLNVDFEYEDENGNPYSSKEILYIPVEQKSGLVVGEVNVLEDTSTDDSILVSIDFYNTGRTAINNLFVSCKGDFETENSNYFIGNLEPGASDYFEALIIPKKEGTVTGTIIFTYEDSNGEKKELEKYFNIDVKKNLDENSSQKEKNEIIENINNESSFSENSFLVLLISPFILSIILIILFRFIKKKRKESANLYEDL